VVAATQEHRCNAGLACFTVDRHDDVGLTNERDAHGFVEVGAGDVQVGVARALQASKGVEGESFPGDGLGDLGGSGFDASAMGRDECDRSIRSGQVDPKVDSRGLVSRQSLEIGVGVGHGRPPLGMGRRRVAVG
jgi:hypothetical protein